MRVNAAFFERRNYIAAVLVAADIANKAGFKPQPGKGYRAIAGITDGLDDFAAGKALADEPGLNLAA
jgi:hypothetical protein